MTPTTFVEASTTLLAHLASPAARTLALAAAAGLGLTAFRVKATNVRLITWTVVLYSSLAMPLLGWVLPSLPVPTPSFVQSIVRSVRQNRNFHATAEQASARGSSPAKAAKRRKNAAQGVSLGIAQDMDRTPARPKTNSRASSDTRRCRRSRFSIAFAKRDSDDGSTARHRRDLQIVSSFNSLEHRRRRNISRCRSVSSGALLRRTRIQPPPAASITNN